MESARWLCFRLHYHDDRDRALLNCVRPVVAELLASAEIDRFFFSRYDLAGPHIRLRLRLSPGERGEVVTDRLTDAATDFLERHPSTESAPAEWIRHHNRILLSGDPDESEQDDVDAVVPDNTLRRCATRFEVDRYGGEELLEHSLDFFVLSSVHALHFLAAHRETPPARRLVQALRLLLHQAWGFSRNDHELGTIIEYPSAYWGEALASFAAEGERAYEQVREDLLAGLRQEFALLSRAAGWAPTRPGAPPSIAEGARRLADALRWTDPDRWWRIGTSQLHMTANRLGLTNPEEVYLGRILWRAVRDLRVGDAVFWTSMWASRAEHGQATGAPALRALMPSTLAWVTEHDPLAHVDPKAAHGPHAR